MKLCIAFIFLQICTYALAGAEKDDIAVRASVDKKTIFIGDRIKYIIEVRSKKNIEVEFPKFQDDKIGSFDIKNTGISTKSAIFGSRLFSNWYYITIYSPGKPLIPSVEVRCREKTQKDWALKKTEPIGIIVESFLAKENKLLDIKDIKGPIHFYQVSWAIVIGALIILSSCVLLVVIYKKNKSAPVKLPHETALEELEAIKGELATGGNVKEYYTKVSDCIRQYIERAFKIKAPEMTTEEFLSSLKNSSSLSLSQKDLLKVFLNACDLVKFAKYMPPRPEIDTIFVAAKNFIEETKDVTHV